MNFLVINGHKYYPYAQGRLNKTLFDEIIRILKNNGDEVVTTVVEDGYNVEEEIEKYKNADFIIFQTPMNWFSVPWILKKYFDDVYAHGVFYTGSKEYGRGGLLGGKKYMFSITCNTVETAFDNPNTFFDGKSHEDLIIALHKTQQFCAMEPVKSFFCFDVVHNPDIEKYMKNLNNHMQIYVLNNYIS